MKDKIQDKISKLEEEFKSWVEKEKDLIEKRRILDQEISRVQMRKIEIQGSYRELKDLLNGEELSEDSMEKERDRSKSKTRSSIPRSIN